MVEKLLNAISALALHFALYPNWVKVLFSAWVVVTAVLLLALILFKPDDRPSNQVVDTSADDSFRLLRERHQVRQMGELENQLPLGELSEGVFGYVHPTALRNPAEALVHREPSDEAPLEVHKVTAQDLLILGYVTQVDALRLGSVSDTLLISLFSVAWEEARTATAIPLARIGRSRARSFRGGCILDLQILAAAPSGTTALPAGPSATPAMWLRLAPGAELTLKLIEGDSAVSSAAILKASSGFEENWSHDDLTSGKRIRLEAEQTYIVVAHIAFLSASEVTLRAEVRSPDGSLRSKPYESRFAGSQGTVRQASFFFRTLAE